MAHFAQLDHDNKVLQVIVVNNDVLENLPFPESEPVGVSFCKSLFGEDTKWAQTSYNAGFRHNYAGIGYQFDPVASSDGAFIPPQPHPSWLLDEATYIWVPPVPYPSNGQPYYWDEETLSWVLVKPTPEPNAAESQTP